MLLLVLEPNLMCNKVVSRIGAQYKKEIKPLYNTLSPDATLSLTREQVEFYKTTNHTQINKTKLRYDYRCTTGVERFNNLTPSLLTYLLGTSTLLSLLLINLLTPVQLSTHPATHLPTPTNLPLTAPLARLPVYFTCLPYTSLT